MKTANVTQKQYDALAESMKVWEKKIAIRDGESVPIGRLGCPCCLDAGAAAFISPNCTKCAIGKDTGAEDCGGTPYRDVLRVGNGVPIIMSPEVREACMAELNYLRDLLDRCVVGEEPKFRVDSVWLHPRVGNVFQVTDSVNMLCKELYRAIAPGEERSVVAIIEDAPSDTPTPFYAPPTKEQLKEWGMKIDRIDVPSGEDKYVDFQGNYHPKGYGYLFAGHHRFDGLRYILTPVSDPKLKAVQDRIAKAKEELEEAEKELEGLDI